MRAVRSANVSKFRATVERMVTENLFRQEECMVEEIAKGAATELGLSGDVVRMVSRRNNHKSAEFVHEVITPMPPPEKGRKKEPPVVTVTRYMVVKESAKIVAYREYLKTQEDETNMGGEDMVISMQRPNRKDFSDE